MSKKFRYKGQFVSSRVFKKKSNFVENMKQGKLKKKCEANAIDVELVEPVEPVELVQSKENASICSGRRIVEIQTLGKNLKCCKCRETLSLENVVGEKRMGLCSTFTVKCDKCPVQTKVQTGKKHDTKDSHHHADVNTKGVLGKRPNNLI